MTITGVNLNGATAVDFGTTPTTKLRQISDTRLQATSPSGSGTVDVTVVGPGGRSATSAADRFGYVSGPPPRPAVTHIEPKQGATGGGTLVTIYGSGLAKASAVNFASQASGRLQPISEDELKAVAPAGSNTVDVTVTTPGGTSAEVSTARYTYVTASSAPPTVTQVKPNQGYENGGEPVTLTGTGLSGATGVDFGGAAVARSQLTSISDTELRVVSPAETKTEIAQDAPTVDITVTTAAGTSKTGPADQFTYLPLPSPPSVKAIRPTHGGSGISRDHPRDQPGPCHQVTFGTAQDFGTPTDHRRGADRRQPGQGGHRPLHRPGHGHRRGRPAVIQPDSASPTATRFEFEFEFVGNRIELEFDNEHTSTTTTSSSSSSSPPG